MSAGDRYEPSMWDRYTEAIEEVYRAEIEGKTCLDCGKCVEPYEWQGHAGIGWCLYIGEFVTADNTPADIECGVFE